MINFKGIYTALITPFQEDNSVDIEGLLVNIQEQIDAGVHGLVLFGSTGESMTLDEEEFIEIGERVVEYVNQRVPLIFGTTHSSTKEAIERAELAQALGADAILVAPPPYNKPTQEGLYQHFRAIADSVAIPMILYNHPFRTSTSISEEVQRKLKCPAMKDSSGKLEAFLDPIQPILAGDDLFFLPAMSLGCSCLVSVLSNVFPKTFVAIFNHCQNNDFDWARELFQELAPFVSALSLESNPIVVKKLMQLYDKPSGLPRLPLTEASPQTEGLLRTYAKKPQLCQA